MQVKTLNLNRPQQRFVTSLPYCHGGTQVWGRGTGKSTVIAFLIDLIVRNMPRSSWAIQGSTYQQILTRTLQGTMASLEKLGYYRDVHYVIQKKPPRQWGWELPWEAPLKFEHYITFYNPKGCVGFHLYSQDREGSSRGPNVDGIICDESLTINPEIFYAEAKMTNRGNDDLFSHMPWHHGIFHFTSMPYGNSGEWLLKQGAYYDDAHYNHRKISNAIADLQIQFLDEKDKKVRLDIWRDVVDYQKKLRYFPNPKSGHFYSEANSFDNIENLSLRYIQEAYDDAPSRLLFQVEVLNKYQGSIDGSFYQGLDRDIHGYKGKFEYNYLDNLEFDKDKLAKLNSRQDADCDADAPLELGLDFGAKINWITVAQFKKPLNALYFIKNFYVKAPKILDDVARNFCEYYEPHRRKVAHIYPDAQGNNMVANSKRTYTDQFCDVLKKNGWVVIVKSKARTNPFHHEKHLIWANLLRATRDTGKSSWPKIYFNLMNCKELFFAMEQTPSVDNKGLIGKDKSSERKLTYNRQEATDSTDAADQIVYEMFRTLINKSSSIFSPIMK